MAIKKQPILTKEDFETALVTLRLSVSEVSRESGIPRHIVSHFRNYGDGMKPEQLAKLRDYFESLGIEFEHDVKQELAAPVQDIVPATVVNPAHPLSTVQPTHYVFPVDSDIRPDVLANALDMIGEADARIADLMKQEAKRNDGFFGNGDLTTESLATLQDVFSLLAANYIIVRMLRGWPAFNAEPATDTPQTFKDIVRDTFYLRLVDAGLIEAKVTPFEPAKESDEEETA